MSERDAWWDDVGPCGMCGENLADRIYEPTAPGPICQNCAEFIANAFWKAHAGEFLTFPNPPSSRKYGKAKIPASLRRAVYERDKYRCVTCESHLDLTLDHIYPESLGGQTVEANLQTMCRPCNLKKGVRT